MRKLKLQIQMSVDGFIADPSGDMSWMIWPYSPVEWSWDNELRQYHIDLTTSSDCILLSRNMAGGFHDHWEKAAENPSDPRYAFAKPIVDMQKVVFTKTIKKSKWKNTSVSNGDFVNEINTLKQQQGKDIIAYGGATFVSSLVQAKLIDEFHLLINPTAIGNGLPIFKTLLTPQNFNLVKAIGFNCGVAVLHYQLKR